MNDTSMNFSAQIAAIVEKTKQKVDNVVERIALDLANRIIMKTPVDVGTLRGNWFPAYARPNLSYNAGSIDTAGAVTLAGAVTSVKASKMYDNIWYLTNSMPYAYRIEYEGWSKIKAPAGMVRISMAEVKAELDRFL